MKKKKLYIKSLGEIAYFEKLSKESDIGIIIIHGLAEHKGRYVEFINKLNIYKYSVFALDLIGHGESCGKRGDIKTFFDFTNELDAFVSHIKGQQPHLKIALFGHSLGGLVSCCYFSKKKDLDFLILSNPLLERNWKLNIFHLIPYRKLSFISVKKRHSESKEMLDYSRKDPLSCKRMSLRLLGEIFITGINYNLKNMKSINVPTLLLGGTEDNLIKTKHFKEIIKKIGSKDKSLKVYSGVRHRLAQSNKKDEVIDDISIWLNNRVK